MKQTKKFTSKIESDAIMLISDALHIVYTLGKGVAFILHSRHANAGSKIGHGEDETSDARSIVTEEILEGRILVDGTRLGGKCVADALSFMVSISFLICHYYHDRYTYVLLAKESMIDRETKLKMEMLARIADPELYNELVDTYGQ